MTASTSSQDNTSYLDFRDSIDSKNTNIYPEFGYYDADSVYSRTPSSPALRDSWQSGSTVRNRLDSIPSVVVSSQDVQSDLEQQPPAQQRPGRAAIVAPAASHNFSRPARLTDISQEMQDMTLGAPDSPLLTPSRSVTLSRKPPSIRANSPASSLYSIYSFYQIDSASPSPTDDRPRFQEAQQQQQRQPSPQPKVTFASSPAVSSPQDDLNWNTASTPLEFLQLGIVHHEANRLRESAVCFEKSATVDGGCGVGMLMYGLTLRHGWGCEKNEKQGFKWLRKAAESAVEDLESVRKGKSVEKEGKNQPDTDPVQSELILAIYEVGQCFFHGWGVAKDQKMGVSYYQVAARLGDPDAQSDLAFCLANGKGCKKDRKEAAKWYRAAVAQGQSDIGLAWIYKEKFQ